MVAKCRVPTLLLAAALLIVACQSSPQPSPAIVSNTSPQPSGLVELVPVEILAVACQPLRVQARVIGVASDKFGVTYVCTTCLGRFPPPSPGQVAPETTAQFDRIAVDRFQADITFTRGGTWSIRSADIGVPNPRPVVHVIETATSQCAR